MNNHQPQIEKFLSQLKTAEERLQDSHRDIQNREEQILKVLAKLVSGMSSPQNLSKCSKQLQEMLFEAVGALQSSIGDWEKQVALQISQRKFVDKFDKSLIVMVYGKVKSGKSSLGNFIAGLDLKGHGISAYDSFPLKITVHETANKSRIADRLAEFCGGFEVKATEATNCIQEFTLGGMAWVDTPGIDALTEQNVALARQYIENAELAIYLSSSDAPMRSGDLKALADLLRKSIPTVLVISKFDCVEEDEDPDSGDIIARTIAKSDESRRQQQQWVREQIREAKLEQTFHSEECVFISTKVAKDALISGDGQAFESSGIPELYERLGSIVSEEALALKARKPKARVNTLLREVLNDGIAETLPLRHFGVEFDGLAKDLRDRKATLCNQQMVTRLSKQVRGAITVPLRELLLQAEAAFDEQRFDPAETQQMLNRRLSEVAWKVVAEELSASVRESLGDIVQRVSATTTMSAQMEGLTRLTETISVSDSVLKERVGAAFGATVGGVIGSLLGGPVGGAIGATIGGWLGGRGGGAVAGTKELEVEVGLNTEQVRAKLEKQLAEVVPVYVAQLLDGFCATWLDPLIQIAEAAAAKVKKAESELQQLKFEG